MKKFINPDKVQWKELTGRVSSDDVEIAARVAEIVSLVRQDGDRALLQLCREIDKADLRSGIEVSDAEIADAVEAICPALKNAIEEAYRNIFTFHNAQKFEAIDIHTSHGVRCVQKAVPLQRVGLYIPGGSAPLFSTVLMLAVPARIAGCKEIILCTPCGKDGKVAPAVLYTARLCGVDRIFKVGGAQAIAAMAYGTETIPQTDKIFGPGNRYVTKAKEIVSKDVAIDMPAGPSEVLVMADETAVPAFTASDLLSQAEHGPDSQVILLCSNQEICERIEAEVSVMLEKLPRKNVAIKALENSRIIIMDSVEDQIGFVNAYAPEHLIISMNDAWNIAERITAAGSVFIGNYTPESAGDYASGTNHTLPTSGWARSMSGVNLDSFFRKITYQEITEEGIKALGKTIICMAEAEGLDAHANAVKTRISYNREYEDR